jgi:hypothetical protein
MGHLADAMILGHKGEQSQVSRALDGDRKPSLVFGTGAGLPAGSNLATVGQVGPQQVWLLVINF